MWWYTEKFTLFSECNNRRRDNAEIIISVCSEQMLNDSFKQSQACNYACVYTFAEDTVICVCSTCIHTSSLPNMLHAV